MQFLRSSFDTHLNSCVPGSSKSSQPSEQRSHRCTATQVTNPPIDPLREGLVMSLEMRLGGRGNLLQPGADTYRQILLKSPILLESELDAIVADPVLKVSGLPGRGCCVFASISLLNA